SRALRSKARSRPYTRRDRRRLGAPQTAVAAPLWLDGGVVFACHSEPQAKNPRIYICTKTCSAAFVIAALAAALGHQRNLADADALVERLRHVVDRQRRDRSSDHRLHLDAGLRGGGGGRTHAQDRKSVV